MKIWAFEKGSGLVKLLMTLPTFKSSVTALSWLGIDKEGNLGILAVGMESGLIELWSLSNVVSENRPNAALVIQFDPYTCHVSAINRLRWRDAIKDEDSTKVQLASCGVDHCVRIFEVVV